MQNPLLRMFYGFIQILNNFFPMRLGRKNSPVLGDPRPIHGCHHLYHNANIKL
jgi:hypothetical protein